MISLTTEIPKIALPIAEIVKINSIYDCYRDIALFWVQDENCAVISMLDGNMTIYNKNADIDELREFISVISPQSIFTDANTLERLFGSNFHKVCVVESNYNFLCNTPSFSAKSDEIYRLLDVSGLDLPLYEYFAVDFCHRLNRGNLKYFAVKDKCVAIGVCDGQTVLVNGIASHQKGMGSLALAGLLSQYNNTAIAVCEENVMPFYLKNEFTLSYYAGYWRKNP